MTYPEFLQAKCQQASMSGFEPIWMPEWLKDFQSHLTDWTIRKGRAALCTDCGTGKTPMQLVWAENVVRHTNKPVLIATPLGVTTQTLREADKFGIDVHRSKDGKHGNGIVVTSYERLHHFDPAEFSGMVCDEGSIIKHFRGATQQIVTEFMRRLPFRLICTATAAPNDFVEMGTLSEAIGELGYTDMISKFFKEDTIKDYLGWGRKSYRFKGHAEVPFWQWVCSWARAMRKPSDYGFSDDGFRLPPMEIREIVVPCSRPLNGMLFVMPAEGLHEQREERRLTMQQRCERVAELVNGTGKPAVVWCHLNPEGELLEKMIPDGMEVAGRHKEEIKEERLAAFASGELRVLITKSKIAGFGLNWQHCAHAVTFPSHSWEQFYQATRRLYRFGQQNEVHIDIVTTEGEERVTANLQRKSDQADRMFTMLVRYMNESTRVQGGSSFCEREIVPMWLNCSMAAEG